MGVVSASPNELQRLGAGLEHFSESLELQRIRLSVVRQTINEAASITLLTRLVRSLGSNVQGVAQSFAAADAFQGSNAQSITGGLPNFGGLGAPSKTTTRLKRKSSPKASANRTAEAASSSGTALGQGSVSKSRAIYKPIPQGWQEAIARQRLAHDNAQAKASLAEVMPTAKKARAKQLKALLADPGSVFLRADGTGDGRSVQVFGELVSARHIIVFVPGMDNEINDYRASLQQRAKAVLAEMQRQAGPGVEVAVVAWLGYDTPDYTPTRLFSQGATSSKARAGASALAVDLARIRQENPSAHITVLAHSYGTVVLGEALKRGLNVTDAVAVGSPGMNATSRKNLLSPNVTLWASKSRKSSWSFKKIPIVTIPVDPISILPTHGEDPSAKGFGAHRFSSGDSIGHSDYFRAGTAALKNIVAIGLGRPPIFAPALTPKPAKRPQKPSKGSIRYPR